MADPGIEPDIENIVGLLKIAGLAIQANRTDKIFRDKFFKIFFKPGTAAFFSDDLRKALNNLRK